jgi:hypothetical protein
MDYRPSELESRILTRELGNLSGFGAKWAAHLLPTVPFETSIEVVASPEDARATAASVLTEVGRSDPDMLDLSAIIGSGYLNLNPTIVTLFITPIESGSRISIRAVAKECLVRQESAKKAAERVAGLLKTRFA